jgi:hypothetical protein
MAPQYKTVTLLQIEHTVCKPSAKHGKDTNRNLTAMLKELISIAVVEIISYSRRGSNGVGPDGNQSLISEASSNLSLSLSSGTGDLIHVITIQHTITIVLYTSGMVNVFCSQYLKRLPASSSSICNKQKRVHVKEFILYFSDLEDNWQHHIYIRLFSHSSCSLSIPIVLQRRLLGPLPKSSSISSQSLHIC